VEELEIEYKRLVEEYQLKEGWNLGNTWGTTSIRRKKRIEEKRSKRYKRRK